MPADGARWATYEDFRGGLYERGNDRECPPNGLLQADDCMPLPTGGLRAGMRWETLVDTSVAAKTFNLPTSGYLMAGFGVFPHSLSATPALRMIALQTTALPASAEVWGSTSTNSTSQSSWTKISSHSSVDLHYPMHFVRFIGTVNRMYYNLAVFNTGAGGVFRFSNNTTAVDLNVTTLANYFLTAHQGRLVGMEVAGGAQKLVYSDVASDGNFGASTNSYRVADQYHGNFVFTESFFPSDLSMLKAEWGWFTVQGDISSPFIRQNTLSHPSQEATWACQTPRGMAYLTKDEGVWVFGGGNFPTHLSPQFVGTPMTEEIFTDNTVSCPSFLGTVQYAGGMLFTPKGYVYDTDLGSWWKTMPLNVSPVFSYFAYDGGNGRLYAARTTSAGGIQILHTSVNESTMLRATEYEFTLPLIADPDRTTVLRQVEYHVQTFDTQSTITTTITHNDPAGGPDVTEAPVVATLDGVTRFQVKVNLPNVNADWIKLTTTMTGDVTEAPMLEKMLVNTQPGQYYRDVDA